MPQKFVRTAHIVLLTLSLLGFLVIPLSGIAPANHDPAKLQVTPEMKSAVAGSGDVTLTARLCAPTSTTPPCTAVVATTPVNIDAEIESGPVNLDGKSPLSPDLTCTVPATQSTCPLSPAIDDNATGTYVIRSWIDHSGSNTDVEADSSEGRLASTTNDCVDGVDQSSDCTGTANAGSTPETDETDVVEITILPAAPNNLDCEPDDLNSPTTGNGSTQVFTCTVVDTFGNPVSGVAIDGENKNGANDPDNATAAGPDYTCTTGGTGACTITVSPYSTPEAGEALICFWADLGVDDEFNEAGSDEDGGDCDTEAQHEDETAVKDLTDLIDKDWEVRRPFTIDVQPETSTATLPNSAQITATLYDQFGEPLTGTNQVNFELFSGSVSDSDDNTFGTPDATCSTAGTTSCSLTYSGGGAGTDLLCAWPNGLTVSSMSGTSPSGTCNPTGSQPTEGRADPTADDGVPNDHVDVVRVDWSPASGPGDTGGLPWENLGGPIISSPDAASWASNRIDVFAVGEDDALWHRWWDGSAWGGWESLGGVLVSDPAAVSWGPNRIDVFAVGVDDALWHRWWDGSGWREWESLGGTLTSGPDVASWSGNRLDVFARGTDNQMWHRWFDGAGWNGWEPLGGVLASDPGAVSWGPNRIDVFVTGIDNGLWHRWFDGGSWKEWESLGGSLDSGPDPSSWSEGRLDVFAVNSDGELIRKWWDGANWLGFENLGAPSSSLGPGLALDPSAVSWGFNRIDVFGVGQDDALQHRWWNGSSWAP